MVIRLAEALEVPVRERNQLLEAAGFAGIYPAQDLTAESLGPYWEAIRYMIASHAPYPAIVKNRHHEVLDMNEPAKRLFLILDPGGLKTNLVEWVLAPNSPAREVFVNYDAVAWGMIYRVRGESATTRSDKRGQELAAFVEERAKSLDPKAQTDELMLCPTMRIKGKEISLVGIVARFGSAQEVNLDEMCVELMHPRDEVTKEFFLELAKAPPLRVAR
jgi:hypothetical protein